MTDGISTHSMYRVVTTTRYGQRPMTSTEPPMSRDDAMALFEQKAARPGFAPTTGHRVRVMTEDEYRRQRGLSVPSCPVCGDLDVDGHPCSPRVVSW